MDMIRIDHLQKHFGDVHAVNDLSFRVKPGELFAFLGVNGAGKSTTINILCGQLKKDGGSVSICELDADKEPDANKRSLGGLAGGFRSLDPAPQRPLGRIGLRKRQIDALLRELHLSFRLAELSLGRLDRDVDVGRIELEQDFACGNLDALLGRTLDEPAAHLLKGRLDLMSRQNPGLKPVAFRDCVVPVAEPDETARDGQDCGKARSGSKNIFFLLDGKRHFLLAD